MVVGPEPFPQHLTVPPLNTAQFESLPAAMAMTPLDRPLTLIGV